LGIPTQPNQLTWFDNIMEMFDYQNDTWTQGTFKVYVCAFFYVAQTFSTIGFGTYYGYSVREYLFSSFLLFGGLIMFTFSFEKVKAIIVSFNGAEKIEKEEVETKVDKMNDFS